MIRHERRPSKVPRNIVTPHLNDGDADSVGYACFLCDFHEHLQAQPSQYAAQLNPARVGMSILTSFIKIAKMPGSSPLGLPSIVCVLPAPVCTRRSKLRTVEG